MGGEDKPHGDGAIGRPAEDLIGRAPLVAAIVAQIRTAPMDHGYVVGLAGPWGSGKTSVMNLVEHELDDDVVVLHFEPWLFTGAAELVGRFFGELADQLRRKGGRRLRGLGRSIGRYGAAVAPTAGLVLGPAAQVLAAPQRLVGAKSPSAISRRDKAIKTLRAKGQRLLVVIDDVDRLQPAEIVEVVRLIKLVGDLPGVTYLLGYEPGRVERALAADGRTRADGRAYLEKIVQAPFSVPPVTAHQLQTLTFGWVDERLDESDLASWDADAWSQLRDEGVDRYLRTLRDGRRFANVAPAVLKLIAREVASADVLALEALRLFDPEVHAALPEIADVLTRGGPRIDFRDQRLIDDENRARVEAALEPAVQREAATTILRRLFPLAAHLLGGSREGSENRDWIRRQRVASGSVFSRYLHMGLGPAEASIVDVERVLATLDDPEALRRVLGHVEDQRLPDLLAQARTRLEPAEEVDVTGTAMAFLELRGRIVEPQGFFGLESIRSLLWVVDDLLETAAEEDRPRLVLSLIEQATSLSTRWQLVTRYGTWSEAGSQDPRLDVLTMDASNAAQRTLVEQALATDSATLAAEPDLLRIAQTVRLVAPNGQADALRLLRDDRACVVAMALGRGDRGALVEIFGEQALAARVRALDVGDNPAAEASVRAVLQS